MRVLSPLLIASIALTLAACSPAPDAPAVPDAPVADAPADAAPRTPQTGTAASPRIMHYDCEGTPVDASFDGRGQVSVAVDGTVHVLRTEDGAEDAKYVDDAGHELWIRGEHNALLMRPDHPDRTCTGNEATPA